MLSLINYLLPLLGKKVCENNFNFHHFFFICVLKLTDYSTEHLKTGLMILEAYVLIAPERVISVNMNFCYLKANFIILVVFKIFV